MKRPLLILILLALLSTMLGLRSSTHAQQDDYPLQAIQHLGRGTAEAVAWHPSEAIFAVAGSQGIWLYDENLADLAAINQGVGWVSALEWSPDGARLASVSMDGAVHIWSVSENPHQHLITMQGQSVHWSADSAQVATQGADGISIWDSETGALRTSITTDAPVMALGWSPDGRLMATNTEDGIVEVHDLTTYEVVATLQQGYHSHIAAIVFSPNGHYLAVARGGVVDIWDTASFALVTTLRGHTGANVQSPAWSPDGQWLATYGGGPTIRIWSVTQDFALSHVFDDVDKEVRSVSWKSDSQVIASVSTASTVRLWSITAAREVRVLDKHNGPVTSIAWSADGKTIASSNADDNRIRYWVVESGQVEQIWAGLSGSIDALALSSTNVLAIARARNVDMVEDGQVTTLDERVHALDWHPIEGVLAGAGIYGVFLWDVEHNEMDTIDTTDQLVNSVAWSLDGQYLAIGGQNVGLSQEVSTLRIFDLNENTLRPIIEVTSPVMSISWAPDSARFAFSKWSGASDIGIYTLETNTTLFPAIEGRIVKWNPVQELLAVLQGTSQDVIVVLDGKTFHPVATQELELYSVNQLAWSPDGSRLATAHNDGVIRVWRVSTK